MNVMDLVRHFSSEKMVPIDINDIKKKILSDGRFLVIRFIGVQMNTDIMRGYLSHYIKKSPLYGEDTPMADIYYDLNQDSDWRRLVCCKEMLHIVDIPPARTSTPEDLKRLINRMSLSPEFENLATDQANGDHKVLTDKLAIIYAVAILFPMKVRDLVLPLVDSRKLTEEDVARMVDIPLRYVRLVLSPVWPQVYHAIIN